MNGIVKSRAAKIALIAIFAALIVALQVFGGFLKIGTVSLSFVLVPIVLGGMVGGVWVGTALGAVFGVVTVVMGLAGADVFTQYLLSSAPVATVAVCLVKATAAGFLSAFVFRVVSKKNVLVATFAAAVVAPVVNTGIFIAGMLLMKTTLLALMESFGAGTDVIYFLFIGCAGVNCLVELGLNVVLAPALYRVLKAVVR